VLKPLHEMRQLLPFFCFDPLVALDLVWHAGYYFQDDFGARPNWAGFMADVSQPCDSFQPACDFRMLPIIDVNPNDMSCIFSTLAFVEKQAKRLNMDTACITFDQPV